MSNYNEVLARNTSHAPQSIGLQSQTVAFSHYNHLSAQLPIDPETGNLVAGGAAAQAEQCFKNIKAILSSIDHSMNDIVRTTIFLQNIEDLDVVNDIYAQFFSDYLPTNTTIAVDALPMDALVQVEAVVTNGVGSIPNAPQAGNLIKVVKQTSDAPENLLSSQTVAFSHYNNLSAQLPIDPVSGEVVKGGIKAQAVQCLKNVKAILESIDVPFDDIVKMTLFVNDLADMDAVNEVYTTFFPDSSIARAVNYFPARTVVEVKALPKEALIQMEAVVSHGDGTPPQEVEDRHGIVIEACNTGEAPKCALSTQTVSFSHYNNLSAQLPIEPASNQLVSEDIHQQAAQCLKNIQIILESVNHALSDVVKVNIYLTDLSDLNAVNDVYTAFFQGGVPARRIVGVSALPYGARVQMDVVAGNAEGTPPKM